MNDEHERDAVDLVARDTSADTLSSNSSTHSYRWNAVLNGKEITVVTSPSRRLVDLLRHDLQMTGTKVSCEIGRCGACMVLVDGQPLNSCLLMAYQCEGKSITTIEGIGSTALPSFEEDPLAGVDPVQAAFLEEGGFQCGYCTPGMILSTKALLDNHPHPTRQQIEEGLCGNLCRCTGYGAIIRSVERAIVHCDERDLSTNQGIK
ncbi:2Fe-2S iron-sulfur cluster-binding protein [Paenibacillus sp. JX-17]|uniref:2Fe-2S iron-sulfur cluster-binding protein n=1 Tax=Paenibacillus lacisoli TaxID=3064525 RepID=A0ABT9CC74_9BACL|nr:2Fe-2S iron-sulfur cluster-binding protein [Paenibacillus sp. JX-17]MDO7905577.1 2Fe-2S iron-sulfur cluster-binding protein [Paenibacillus sp. JX-17]